MKNKNIVIIGGNSGIGKTVMTSLKTLGANVFSYSRSQEGDSQLDVTKDFDEIINLPIVIDGLLYCPGSINLKPFHRLSIADFQNDYNLNVLGAVRVLQACMKGLKKSNSASVVLFSTVAVGVGMGFHSSVSSAKGAVEGLAKSLAAEWASYKIRVNVIAPSLTATPLAYQLLSSDDKKDAAKKRHPLGRYGKPEDIASAALYLLSEDTSWMTGQVLHLDGGMSAIR